MLGLWEESHHKKKKACMFCKALPYLQTTASPPHRRGI